MTEHYDVIVIVIGSGAGGGTPAWALAPTGKRILLLERGDVLPREPENWSPKALWLEGRYHNSGKWTNADNGKEFSPKQNYHVDGNTKFSGAILFRFRERDFGELHHVHGQRGIDPTDPPSEAPYRYPPLSHDPASPSWRPTWPPPGCDRSRYRWGSSETRPTRPPSGCRRASAAPPSTATRAGQRQGRRPDRLRRARPAPS